MQHETHDRCPVGAIHGRFQPFHNGHFDYLTAALELADLIYVGITNPQAPLGSRVEDTDAHRHLPENNPFTFSERERMVHLSTERARRREVGRLVIVPFDVNGDPALWPDIIPLAAVQYVVHHEPWDDEKAVRFERAGYHVQMLPRQRRRVTATEIRGRIARGDSSWKALVPAGTAEFLTDTNLIARVQCGTQPDPS